MRTPAGRDAIAALDGDLRDPRNTRNPGATADLTAAALFAALLEGGWRRGGVGSVVDAEVIGATEPHGTVASDHYGVLATVRY